MIAKIPRGRKDGKSSFRDLIRYCLGLTGHSKGAVLHIGSQNLLNDTEDAYKEMEFLASLNTRCRVPAMHFILSWREMESPTFEQVDEAVGIALKELDLDNCQALWALQNDTENLHVHVVVNRISPNTLRPIRSNGGWTKKGLEKAARKIELIQGWEVEKSGRYTVDKAGNVHEKIGAESIMPEVSQTARDIEAHTGGESFERMAKREVASILESAKSWEELHVKLAAKGFEFERKGNGAVLKFADKAVKLSHVSRSSSFSKLEQRLGKYETRKNDVEISTSVKMEVKPLREKSYFEEYQTERKKYFESKISAIKKLKIRQKEEREKLHEVQKGHWQELHSESWKGKRNELNFLRSFTAYVHKKEQLNLRDEQREELQELKSHYPQRFPSYKEWLFQNRDDEYQKYRYSGEFLMLPLTLKYSVEAPKIKDLRDYEAKIGAGGSVLYCRAGTNTADFSDKGRRIILNHKNLSEESVLAALQLANEKWGATQINGSDEYKALCVSVAVKYGLKIANPDLSAEVERRRKEQREKIFSYRPVTFEEIEKLNLVENPLIYVNPRKDNQDYKGQIVHVDRERGYCVQLVGQRSLFVHRLDKFDNSPKVGETLKISYVDEHQKVKVKYTENNSRVLHL